MIIEEEADMFPESEEVIEFQRMIRRSLEDSWVTLEEFKNIFKISVGAVPAFISDLDIQLIVNSEIPRGLQTPPRRFSFEDTDYIAKEINKMK